MRIIVRIHSFSWALWGVIISGYVGAAAPVEILDTRTSYTAPARPSDSTVFEAPAFQSPAFEPITSEAPSSSDMGMITIQSEEVGSPSQVAFTPQPVVMQEAVVETQPIITVEELPAEVARLTARLEELEQKIATMDQTLQEQAKKGAARAVVAPLLAGQTEAQPAKVPLESKPQPLVEEIKHLSPEEAYEAARGYITQADYPRARRALEEFVRTFHDHALASAALYWMGETYFVEKDYKVAAQKFLEAYKHNPQGSKAPDVLLKLALCLENLGKKQEACTTLKKLFKEYPTMNGSIKGMAQRTRDRLKCKK